LLVVICFSAGYEQLFCLRPGFANRLTAHSLVSRSTTAKGDLFWITVANRDYHYLSRFEIAGSIKGDVNKKGSPSAGSREIFCLDIQPTIC
jgi:hypothetical protein